ncbi:hypothetical protein Tco_1198154 [Tanacetum coccineum]
MEEEEMEDVNWDVRPQKTNKVTEESKTDTVYERQKVLLQDTNHKLIKIVKFNLLTEDYDEFIDKLRRYFNTYKPLESIPLLKIQFIITTLPPQAKPLEGIVLRSNGYLHAINNGVLLEFGELDKEKPHFLGSKFLGFTEKYPSMSEGIEGVNGIEGLSVGFNELKDAVEKILIEPNIPTSDNKKKPYERLKVSLLTIIVMVLEGARFKPFSRVITLAMRPTIKCQKTKPIKISPWMKEMSRHFSYMTKVAKGDKPFKHVRTKKRKEEKAKEKGLLWIHEKFNDQGYCIEELGFWNQQEFFDYYEKEESDEEED